VFLKRSVLTEKIARRGYHLSREYDVDPLEVLFVREVMWTDIVTFAGTATLADVSATFVTGRRQVRNTVSACTRSPTNVAACSGFSPAATSSTTHSAAVTGLCSPSCSPARRCVPRRDAA
jgi:hypothetical protein